MTGLHQGDSLLYHRPVAARAALPLRHRIAAAVLTAMLLGGLTMVFLHGTEISILRLSPPAMVVALDRDIAKPPPPGMPPLMIAPRTAAVAAPQVVIAPDPAVPIASSPVAVLPAPVAASAGAPDPGIDIAAIGRAYIIKVQNRLAERMIYPSFARRMGEEGSAMVSIVIAGDGTVLSETLIKSSGYSDLDREALAMVERASPLPPIPAVLHLDRLERHMPITFQIGGQGMFAVRR